MALNISGATPNELRRLMALGLTNADLNAATVSGTLGTSAPQQNALDNVPPQADPQQFVRNEQTGQTIYFKPNGGGAAPGQGVTSQGGGFDKPVKVYGANDSGMIMDLGFDAPGSAQPDYSRMAGGRLGLTRADSPSMSF
jgi:hypothetical protein